MAGKPSQLRTILLADHEAETRSLVAAVLQRAGYDVVQADSGDDVMDAARREMPHLVILEVTLPALSGYELCHQLREEFGVAPNTVLSAIRVLRDEGLVSSQQGRGTYVRAVPEPGSSGGPTPEFELVMDQLEQFQAELHAMRQRLEQLELRTAQLFDEEGQPTQ